jgi:hypothetical protein
VVKLWTALTRWWVNAKTPTAEDPITPLPPVSQASQGDKAVQVGEMPDGHLQVLHVQTMNVISHAPIPAPTPAPAERHTRHRPGPTVYQTLQLMKKLNPYGKRGKVLDFMEMEFGTVYVKELDERALRRTYAYAKTILENCKKEEQRSNVDN